MNETQQNKLIESDIGIVVWSVLVIFSAVLIIVLGVRIVKYIWAKTKT